jgi:hypothetical protein
VKRDENATEHCKISDKIIIFSTYHMYLTYLPIIKNYEMAKQNIHLKCKSFQNASIDNSLKGSFTSFPPCLNIIFIIITSSFANLLMQNAKY